MRACGWWLFRQTKMSQRASAWISKNYRKTQSQGKHHHVNLRSGLMTSAVQGVPGVEAEQLHDERQSEQTGYEEIRHQ